MSTVCDTPLLCGPASSPVQLLFCIFISGHRTWNLHIRDVQRSDAGAYMCQINTAKAKTRMGHLTVVGKSYGNALKMML